MRKNAVLSVAALCLASFNIFAQSAPQQKATLTLPYDVTVDRTLLPAGEYVFQRLSTNNEALMIYSVRDAKSIGIFLCNPAGDQELADHSEAVLKHVGDHYYMEEFRLAGQLGLQLHTALEKAR